MPAEFVYVLILRFGRTIITFFTVTSVSTVIYVKASIVHDIHPYFYWRFHLQLS